MKITEKIVGKLADSVRDDLSKIAEEQTPQGAAIAAFMMADVMMEVRAK